MNRQEITALLGLMAGRDGRTVGRVEVEAWFEDVGEWDFETARLAVKRHYSRSRDFMRPFDLIGAIKEIRGERLTAAGELMPNVDPDDSAAWVAEIRALRKAIADGSITAEAYRAAGRTLTGAPPRALPGTSERTGVVQLPKFPRPPKPLPAQREDKARAVVPATVDAAVGEDLEAERARQLAALEAIADPADTREDQPA